MTDEEVAAKVEFDPAALGVVVKISNGVVDGVCRGIGRAPGTFSSSLGGEEAALSHIGLQALALALCSFAHAAFGGRMPVETLLARVRETWNDVQCGVTLGEVRDAQRRRGQS